MAQKPSVHIEFREEGWVVVREGNKRATSSHPTQSEAAENGRNLARRDKTEFFLHAQDGRIREHRDYRDEPDKGVLDQASETVGAVTGVVTGTTGAAAQALGTGGERDRTEPVTEDDQASGDTNVDTSYETSNQDDTKEVRGLTEAESGGPSERPEERYADYEIYDQDSEWIGPLNELFVDENDEPEYVGVGTSAPGNRSILVPVETVTVDDRLHSMMVSRPRTFVAAGPSLGHEDEVTPEVERRVRVHYGLETSHDAEDRAGYGAYYPGDALLTELESGDILETGAPEDEVRVQRAEEEIRVETRERESGAMRVRKRVRTDRERIEVPKKRVEVTVERVPVDGGAVPAGDGASTAPQIGEEEIVVPVIEEEIVVEKRPVVKEEIRIRKQVVEDTEVVEEEVRREEVEIDEQTRPDVGSHADVDDDLER
jgi:uncharacterized protein (TIGR02271 family)